MSPDEPARIADDPEVQDLVRSAVSSASRAQATGFDRARALNRLESAMATVPSAPRWWARHPAWSATGFVGVCAVVAALAIATHVSRRQPVAPRPSPVPSMTAPVPVATAPTPTVVLPPIAPRPESSVLANVPVAPESPAPSHASPRRAHTDVNRAWEAQWVARANRSLASQPSEALSIVRRVEREYPDGDLVEERDAIEIDALRRLGRMTEARPLATEFLHRHPHSPQSERMRQMLSGSGS